MHTSTIASNRAALGTCLLSTLVLGPLPAQETSGRYASDERSRSARVERRHTRSDNDLIPSGNRDSLPVRPPEQPNASAPTQCGADLGIADASVVIEELPEPAYVHTLSKSEISSLENESSGRLRGAVGLTLVLAGTVETKMGEAQTQGGATCAIVEGVRIIPMKEVTVYVAREYTLGSCNYNAVKRHEDQHVAIARGLVSEYRPRLLRAVTGLHLQSHEFATQAIGESASTRKIVSEVQSAVQRVIDELQQAMRDANRLLDQSDTGKTLRKCSSW